MYGRGRVIKKTDKQWQELISLFPSLPGTRQIILLGIESIQTSCGYGVPVFELKQERQTLIDSANKKGDRAIQEYWQQKNQVSIDGLPTKLLEN